MINTIIFDFDGTLADTTSEFVRIVNKLADKYSFKKIKDEDIEKFREYDAISFFKAIQIPLWKVPLAIRDGKLELHKTIELVKPAPGMKKELVKLYKHGFTLGILTSNSQKNVKKFLDKHAMHVFDFIYTGSNIFGKDKVMHALLKEKGLKKEEVIYIGDETRDIEATKKVGMKIIAVTWGYGTRRILLKYQPDFLIDKPEEIIKTISKNS